MKRMVLCLVISFALATTAIAQNYTVDVGQPDFTGAAFPPPDDILAPGFPPTPVLVGGTGGGNVDAISYNAIGPTPNEPGFMPFMDFSVDLLATGAAGTAVATESAIADAQTDVFRSFGFGGNVLTHDGDGSAPAILPPLGLTEGAAASFGGVDGYEAQPTGPPAFGSVYWSVDAPSLVGPYAGTSAADVFTGTYATGPVLFASEAALGLVPGDEVDALHVYDRGAIGVFDAPDFVLFSLDPASPSLGPTFSPGDIFATSGPGGFLGPVIAAGALGLTPSDNVNAISLTPVPEPASLAVIGLLGIGCCLRRRRSI